MSFCELVFELSRAWRTQNRKLLVLAARYYRGTDSLEELRQAAGNDMADYIVSLR